MDFTGTQHCFRPRRLAVELRGTILRYVFFFFPSSLFLGDTKTTRRLDASDFAGGAKSNRSS